MNNTHLEQIIDNYLTRFDELNRTHEEYYKWQIACRFKDAMDEALDASDKDFPGKLLTVKKLTENLIDSYTQPFGGLVKFSEYDQEKSRTIPTIRKMFKDLFSAAQASVPEKQIAIQDFLDRSHQLRDQCSPNSFLYNDDLHSVTGYLFLYDPDHNYLYKASHCRSFADCIEFYDDWGYGANTRLDVFFKMCDEVLPFLKSNTALMSADAGRFEIDPEGMHPDQEKHILLFDLIYCCTSYGLFKGISFNSPKTAERKLFQEKKEKAQELAAKLSEAQADLSLLNEAKAWLGEALKPGAEILHSSFGTGTIVQLGEDTMLVDFPTAGSKTFATIMSLSKGFIRFDSEALQSELLKHQDILRKDKQIRDAVTWAENDLAPYTEYLT